MARTRSRPLPAGRLHPGAALAFGILAAAAALALLGAWGRRPAVSYNFV